MSTVANNIDPNTASIGNLVWLDSNGNGIFDASEVGVSGVTVFLTGAGADGLFGTSDDISSSVTTDSYGAYSFTELAAGNYTVAFAPEGFVFTTQHAGNACLDSDADPISGATHVINLAPGEKEHSIDAGLMLVQEAETASLGNKVWFDTNGNGLFDQAEDGGVPNVIVTLTGAGNDGALGTADDQVLIQTTDSNGNYSFDGLAAGDYQVTFSGLSDGYEFTQQNVGSDFFDSDADQVTGMTDVISLAAGQNERRIDAGIISNNASSEAEVPQDSQNASIGNKVWLDTNGNGIFEQAEEGGVANVTVTLTGAGDDDILGTADDTTVMQTTDGNGNYNFTGLAAGDYQVTFSNLSDGYEFTQQNAGSDFFDSDADPITGMTDVISLAEGKNERRIDAGLILVNNDLDIESCIHDIGETVVGTGINNHHDDGLVNSNNPDLTTLEHGSSQEIVTTTFVI